MSIMQTVMPAKNRQFRKLLHFCWEIYPKYNENGKLKKEMILVVGVLFASDLFRSPHLPEDLLSILEQCYPQ